MARASITAAISAALALAGAALPTSEEPDWANPSTGRRKHRRVIPTTEKDATAKRERKNALRLKQAFYDHKPTNHPGREFIGCDERREQLAERKAILFEHGATADRLRHRPDKPRRRRVDTQKSRRDRQAGKGA